MNASVDTMALDSDRPRTPRAAPHATHKLKLLLRREFWEHKGGFFWAPIWAGGISLVLTLMALVFGEVAARRAIAAGKMNIGADVKINGLDLSSLTVQMDTKDMQHLSSGIDFSMLSASMWPLITLGFVVFFYCLGTLYDERKDRSVLFWKSLPVSDRDTVLSKAMTALVVAPTLAVGAAIVTMFAFLVMISAFALLHHGNPVALIWGPGSPLKVAVALVAAIPVYALWALPTVGWLMLCSVWSRSKPFLWALMLPLFSWVIVTWFGLMNVFNLDAGWFGRNIVARALTGVFPGSHLTALADSPTWKGLVVTHGFDNVLLLTSGVQLFKEPSLWIGALAGAVMIYAAIRLRRWRDDS